MPSAALPSLLLLPAIAFAQRAEFATVQDDPALPRVLLIGDSISIGYTLPVREKLEAIANVHRPPVNCGPTSKGVQNLEEWLAAENDGGGEWDVIHFNFGLHDLKYIDEKGQLTSSDEGTRQVPPEQYRRNMTAIVDRLEKTGATLIWRPTTIVPKKSTGRVAGDEREYNRIAAEVIDGRDIKVNDLNPLIEAEPKLQRPANVHFTAAGSDALAESVAAAIREALKDRGIRKP